MNIVIFNNKHKIDLDEQSYSCLYLDASSVTTEALEATVERISSFKPDLFIEEEKNDGVSRFTDIYKRFPKVKKAWWMIDAHTNLIEHVVYAKQFDYIFCAQSWFIPIIEHEVKELVFFLPLCHTQTLTEYENMLKYPVEKDIPFSFIGNVRSFHVDRAEYVMDLLEIMGDSFFAVRTEYDKSLWYLRRSNKTFNCSLNNDLNFRVWEAIACQTIPVTDMVNDLDMVEGLRDYVITYDKMSADWKVLDQIVMFTTQERDRFIRKHTMTNRYKELLEMAQHLQQVEYR